MNKLITEVLALVGIEHVLTVAYSKEENAKVERANKEVNRHVRHVCFDRRIKSNWRQTLSIAQKIINFHFSERTGVSPADIMFGKALDLDRGILSALPEDQMNAKGSLSSHMVNLSKTQSEMIERCRQIIQRVAKHTLLKQKLQSILFSRQALTFCSNRQPGNQKIGYNPVSWVRS